MIDREVLQTEGGIERRHLEAEIAVGELDDAARGDEPGNVVYRFLHENGRFGAHVHVGASFRLSAA